MKHIYKTMFSISVLLVVSSVVAILVWGLPLGADFRGGSVLEVGFLQERPSINEIKESFSRVEESGEPNISYIDDNGVIIRLASIDEEKHQEVLSVLSYNFGEITERRFDSIGPVIGEELKSKSITAIILVLVSIIIYIALVFRRLSNVLSPWVMGFSAIIALAHDIIVPIGVFAVFGRYFGFEISAIFVAALLTILGYSVSDTVVVFDRVRENILRFGSGGGFAQTVHKSVIQTLSRSINTTVSTVLALVAIYFFGGQSLQWFSLALIIGIVAGSYSSIFVASPLLVWLSRKK
ncbi:MAG: protein translocase subunit SecF [Candidatus Yanofskybacteria bacterium CG10_big_fil_rev_8_21_14_0_10_36_16]|uniref:Protein-export membrane protein SecF n=1 Tax=Candidatus Yanofskybacteria bacterium CG10_big_fil_rev_8_21_14_0_10_36_16 TaxID=1975096 RepID=A0A2J0Q895_9BACT|nr:MAG: protein translocase subunit SecF [Candidatus Yanofskybacteria bacterium CG10_big_fil_rev_8_21_14_0_10_36_16]